MTFRVVADRASRQFLVTTALDSYVPISVLREGFAAVAEPSELRHMPTGTAHRTWALAVKALGSDADVQR
jgi:hypothetical protein